MIAQGQTVLTAEPRFVLIPSVALFITVLSLNLVADGLRDALGRERFGLKAARRRRGARRTEAVAARATRAEREAPPTSDHGSSTAELLTVEHLRVEFATRARWLPVVEDVSFGVLPGRTLGLVGESGSGKTVSALAIMGLLPKRESRIPEGAVHFSGIELTRLNAEKMRQIRGNDIAMIFQEPMTSRNPRPLAASEGLSPRLLRRHASEGHDRHGSFVRTQTVDRR